eukprot:3153030-Amphidinium_carterae.1
MKQQLDAITKDGEDFISRIEVLGMPLVLAFLSVPRHRLVRLGAPWSMKTGSKGGKSVNHGSSTPFSSNLRCVTSLSPASSAHGQLREAPASHLQ